MYDITREREILTAKVNIHDMLGKALLVTKRYIENGDVDVSKKELTDIVIAAKKFTDRNDMEIDFTSPGLIDSDVLENMGMNVPMCGACISNMAIAPGGSVVPCQSWLGADASLGNLLTDDFKLIWNNPKCLSLRFMSEDEALACPFRTGKR